MEYRQAVVGDAAAIGRLHATSWIDEYDGELSAADRAEVVAGRVVIWHDRLSTGGRHATATFVAVGAVDGVVRGFVHTVADHDPRWGSLLGELHVQSEARRAGIARQLFVRATTWLAAHATSDSLYLLVRSENLPARRLYESLGGQADSANAAASAPGLRYCWTGLPGRTG
ncbi:GNAT family N-acetyltransferase [Flindersiella endophytica]